eukprot:Skav227417  [mRNA]  locus=scaffold950:170975:180950:- [translate_table: standard]
MDPCKSFYLESSAQAVQRFPVDLEKQPDPSTNATVHWDDKFYLGKRLGSGSFGQVFLAKNRRGKELAVKVERMACNSTLLFSEAHLLRRLTNAPGFPRVHHICAEGPLPKHSFVIASVNSGYNMLAMDLLGPSLDTVFQKCGRHFSASAAVMICGSLKTVLMMATQMLDRLSYLHSKDWQQDRLKAGHFGHEEYVHRDIKPENFLIGLGERRNATCFELGPWSHGV